MNDPLAPLRQRFRTRLVEDLERLRSLRAAPHPDQALRVLAHNLAGAAGIFGLVALSRAAITIDDRHVVGERSTDDELDALEAEIEAALGTD